MLKVYFKEENLVLSFLSDLLENVYSKRTEQSFYGNIIETIHAISY